jgi:hypothetical protein
MDHFPDSVSSFTSRRCRNQQTWNILSSGNAKCTSRWIELKISRSFAEYMVGAFLRPSSISLALFKASLYVSALAARWLPNANDHTWPLHLGATPCHQSSLVDASLQARLQFGIIWLSQTLEYSLCMRSLDSCSCRSFSARLRSKLTIRMKDSLMLRLCRTHPLLVICASFSDTLSNAVSPPPWILAEANLAGSATIPPLSPC